MNSLLVLCRKQFKRESKLRSNEGNANIIQASTFAPNPNPHCSEHSPSLRNMYYSKVTRGIILSYM